MIGRLWAIAAIALFSTGCASLGAPAASNPFALLPDRVDLDATPFFPQRKYQCGPAALATVLTASGVDTSAEALVPRVYVPARRGSLQVEMLAASRTSDRIPFVIEPTTRALAREVSGGQPVLVLLNLGVAAWPRWHYAVVVGFDSRKQLWWLRSGTKRRETMSLRRFDGAWRRADRWGFVVLEPGTLPVSEDVDRFVAAVAQYERFASAGSAVRAYQAAVVRNPNAAPLQFGLGNALLASGHTREAANAFRAALALDAGHVPARNNLADVLNRSGCRAAALREVELALRAAVGGPYETAVRSTLAEIQASTPERTCENSATN